MKSACLKVFEICNQNLDNWLYSWSLLKGKFSSLVKGLFERSQKRINSISPCFSLKITLVDQINIEIVLILFRYYLTLFTTIWFFFLHFICIFFLLDIYKETNVQKYKCTKDSLICFNWAFSRNISQKLIELPFQWRNIFCTYKKDKKIRFGIKERLLERHLQRWSFEYCLQRWDYN